MYKNYSEIMSNIAKNLKTINKNIPETISAFNALTKSSHSESSLLDQKTKELIALAIGITSRCDGCIAFHTKKLVELNVTKEEFFETIGVAIYMGGGPSLMYGSDAVLAYEQFCYEKETANEK